MSRQTRPVDLERVFERKEWAAAIRSLRALRSDQAARLHEEAGRLAGLGRYSDALLMRRGASNLIEDAERLDQDLRKQARKDPTLVSRLLDPNNHSVEDWFGDH